MRFLAGDDHTARAGFGAVVLGAQESVDLAETLVDGQFQFPVAAGRLEQRPVAAVLVGDDAGQFETRTAAVGSDRVPAFFTVGYAGVAKELGHGALRHHETSCSSVRFRAAMDDR